MNILRDLHSLCLVACAQSHKAGISLFCCYPRKRTKAKISLLSNFQQILRYQKGNLPNFGA
jgi:hypothetical protein